MITNKKEFIFTKNFQYKDNTAIFLAVFCFSIAMAGIILENVFQLTPCILCVIQRGTFFYLFFVFFIDFLFQKKRRWQCISKILTYLGIMLGLITAARQIWLSILPPNAQPACLPNFQYLIKVLGPIEAIQRYLISAGSECGQIDFRLFGLSLAHYSLFVFIFLLFVMLRKKSA